MVCYYECMLEIRRDIDTVVSETSELMRRVYEELHQKKINPENDHQRGTSLIAFLLGFEYFITSRDALTKGMVIGGGMGVRTGLENIIDILYIYSNPGKYTEPYISSMNKFNQVMYQSAGKDFSEVMKSRDLKQANKWTNSSIEDRLAACGESLTTAYDMLSYFGHPNPGALNWVLNAERKDGQLNLLKQTNCMNALVLMTIVQNFTDGNKVSFTEINQVAQKIGFTFEFDDEGKLNL